MTSSTSSAIGTGSRIGALATVSIVAGKEFRDCLRSRWVWPSSSARPPSAARFSTSRCLP